MSGQWQGARVTCAADLDRVDWCPMGERCETCSSEMELNLEAVMSVLGVYCVTICDECTMFNRFPRLTAAGAAAHVLEHCHHLGITVDRMAELLDQNRPG